MSKTLAHHCRTLVLLKHDAGMEVPKVLQFDLGYPYLPARLRKARVRAIGFIGPPRGSANTRSLS